MSTVTETAPITLSQWNDRIEPLIERTDAGCWEWLGTRLPHGYGTISIAGAKWYLHRLSHEMWVGPIGEGLHIDHLCRNRPCLNPEHIEAVTQRVNNLRSESFAGERHRQTHCINGHAFDEINTYVAPNGTRKCRTCRSIARRRSEHRARAA